MIAARPAPRRVSLAANWPTAAIVVIAVLLPGVASVLLRGWHEAGKRVTSLWLTLGVAYLLCGPMWGGLFFARAGHLVKELGLVPFVATCLAVVAISVRATLEDRKAALAAAE